MKKFLLVVALILALFLAACGPPEQNAAGGGSSDGDSDSQAAAATPTPVVLATPTPRPAPPTPTPRPTATPAPIESAPEAEGSEETEEGAESEVEAPAGPLFEDMVLIPAGSFTMGSEGGKPRNAPAHEVDLPAYEIDRFEVTNDEFAYFVEQTGYVTFAEENRNKTWRDFAEAKGSHPVVYVNRDDAAAYCEWAGKRLPTEAEWEKAARGEAGLAYPWGDDFSADNGNFKETGLRGTSAVGSFPGGASPYGIEDMAGNVSEWTANAFLAYPGAAADADPFFGDQFTVHRGGGWFGEEGNELLTFNRNAGPPDETVSDEIGFRCVRDAE